MFVQTNYYTLYSFVFQEETFSILTFSQFYRLGHIPLLTCHGCNPDCVLFSTWCWLKVPDGKNKRHSNRACHARFILLPTKVWRTTLIVVWKPIKSGNTFPCFLSKRLSVNQTFINIYISVPAFNQYINSRNYHIYCP